MLLAAPQPVGRVGGLDDLTAFARRHPRLLVLTGAGCSTGSGIPDYRDPSGAWKHRRPVSYADFTGHAAVRQRYWARSLVGWARLRRARPNEAHRALARLEELGFARQLVTQNVDGLHRQAGSRRVIELHGGLDRVTCLGCGQGLLRDDLQRLLADWNPAWAGLAAEDAPDGDARLEGPFDGFRVPDCPACGGLLKPDVVFFGESVPKERVAATLSALREADALLVAGSSLMVWSGHRFCLEAAGRGQPVAAVNLGRTRADALLALKVESDCAAALPALAEALARRG